MLDQWKRLLFRPPDPRYPLRWLCFSIGTLLLIIGLVNTDGLLALGQCCGGTMNMALFIADSLPRGRRRWAGMTRSVGSAFGGIAIVLLALSVIMAL